MPASEGLPGWRTCDCGWQHAYYRDLREKADGAAEEIAEADARAERAEAEVTRLRDVIGQDSVKSVATLLRCDDLTAERDALRAALAALVEKLNNCTDISTHCVEDDDLDEAEAVLAALSGPAPEEKP